MCFLKENSPYGMRFVVIIEVKENSFPLADVSYAVYVF